MADIFREIDEDLRRDSLIRLYQRYGRFAIGGAVLVVLGVAGFEGWSAWQQRQAEADGLRFTELSGIAEADPAKAVASLEVLADRGASGYRLLARFEAAGLKARGSDRAGGIAAMRAIADDARVDPEYRDLARLLAAGYAVDTAPAGEITSALQPLTIAPNPWRFAATELIALARYKAGDTATAVKLYQQLADDLDAPHAMRARAAEIVGASRHQG